MFVLDFRENAEKNIFVLPYIEVESCIFINICTQYTNLVVGTKPKEIRFKNAISQPDATVGSFIVHEGT